jgi:hypothetical protein
VTGRAPLPSPPIQDLGIVEAGRSGFVGATRVATTRKIETGAMRGGRLSEA